MKRFIVFTELFRIAVWVTIMVLIFSMQTWSIVLIFIAVLSEITFLVCQEWFLRKKIKSGIVDIIHREKYRMDRHDIFLLVLAVLLVALFAFNPEEFGAPDYGTIYLIVFYSAVSIRLLTRFGKGGFFIENRVVDNFRLTFRGVKIDEIEMAFINSKANLSIVSNGKTKEISGETTLMNKILEKLVTLNPNIKTSVNNNQSGAFA